MCINFCIHGTSYFFINTNDWESIPQLGFGSETQNGVYLLDKLNGLHKELGFSEYTSGEKSKIDVFFITAALMIGTAGLPHVIVRFFTVKKLVMQENLLDGLFYLLLYFTQQPLQLQFLPEQI